MRGADSDDGSGDKSTEVTLSFFQRSANTSLTISNVLEEVAIIQSLVFVLVCQISSAAILKARRISERTRQPVLALYVGHRLDPIQSLQYGRPALMCSADSVHVARHQVSER